MSDTEQEPVKLGRGTRPGRPTKYNEALGKYICDRIRVGCTQTAAYTSAKISIDTFQRWQDRYKEFGEAVRMAKAEAEILFTTSLTKAAQGAETTFTETVERTVLKPETTSEKKADGTVSEKTVYIPYKVITTTTRTVKQADWRAAESWLKRRNPAEWRENLDITTDGQAINTAFVVGLEKIYGDNHVLPQDTVLAIDEQDDVDGEVCP